jgi:hypothetical protein
MIIAAANDYYGAKTFSTLDRQLRNAWRSRHGLDSQTTLMMQGNMTQMSISRASP